MVLKTQGVCWSISRQALTRCYSQNAAPGSLPASGRARLGHRALISLHGQDAPKFLQGLVTANIRPGSRSALYAAFLNAQGKVLSDAFIYPTLGSDWHKQANGDEQPGYLVEVDRQHGEALLGQLKKHKLRSKFKLTLLDESELQVWSTWREDDRWTPHKKGGAEDGQICVTDSRAPGMGQRLLLPASSSTNQDWDSTIEVPQSVYDARRYIKGVPEGQGEIPREESLPMNCNMDIMGGIDFKKGCYVGQELTIRTHHTGVVRRRVLPVMLYEPGAACPEQLEYLPTSPMGTPERGADIKRDDQRKRSTGKFVAGFGNVGLAMCRLEQMSDLKISGEGSSFDPADRFIIDGPSGSQCAVRAFVPDWMRSQIREPRIQKRVG